MKYYKFINMDGTTPQRYGEWDLPKGRKMGAWQEAKPGKIKCCSDTAIHVMVPDQIIHWLGSEAALWEVEVQGKIVKSDEKCGVKKARVIKQVTTWNEKSARLLACDFAEEVMPIWDKQMSDDDRPRKVIEVARKYANGKATKDELTAARAAAWAAARDAAWAAARAAASAAARAAARAAMQKKQTKLLRKRLKI
jgi:hypothetical protein